MAKVAVATSTAALTIAFAGVAAAVLVVESGDSSPGVTQSASVRAATVADPLPTAPGEPGAQAGGGASASTPAGSTTAAAQAGGSVESARASRPSAPASPVPEVSVPTLPVAGAVPNVSGLTQLPAQVMGCITPILDLVTGLPAVSTAQITQIGPRIVACVSGIVRSLPLPFGLDACISEILGFVGGIASQMPTGTPSLGGLDVAACIPVGLPVPGGLPSMGGGFSFGR